MNEQEERKIGHYQLIELLGKGEIGEVYKAYDQIEERPVALKLLLPELTRDPRAVELIEQEARAAAKLNHKNVVKIYAVERTATGHPYIVMELIDGRSLAEVIREKIEYSTTDIIELMIQAAEGLRAALIQRLIHCDVKPRNMLIAFADELKLLDFGLAKAIWTPTQPQRPGVIAGTPQYMSPEQAGGRALDHRSDIYSLGASFYHILAGRLPFEADTAPEIMDMHRRVPLIPLRKWRPDVVEELSDIIDHMMAKLPEDRYQDYDMLIADLTEAKQAELSRARGEKEVTEAESIDTTAELVHPPPASFPADKQPIAAESARHTLETIKHEEIKQSWTILGRKLIAALAFILFLCGVMWLASITVFNPFQPQQPPGRSLWKILTSLRGEKESVPYNLQLDKAFKDNLNTYRAMVNIYQKRTDYEFTKGQPLNYLDELVNAGYLQPEQTRDAWGKPFMFVFTSGNLISTGADGLKGSEDDFVLNSDGIFERIPEEFWVKATASDLKLSDKVQ